MATESPVGTDTMILPHTMRSPGGTGYAVAVVAIARDRSPNRRPLVGALPLWVNHLHGQ